MTIDTLLQPWARFGMNLGLARIEKLLAALGNPHLQVPIIHVTGTNGKGSVCAYLSAVLTAAGYKVGRYTSPHLIDWTERICLNEQKISEAKFCQVLEATIASIDAEIESPTQFEIITAAAFLYFARSQADIAVIEVGLGGRLDSTNVCDRPLVTIITSISREHWQVLGPELTDIAREKAGILKPHCPAVIGPLPPEALQVVKERIEKLGCPAVFPPKAQEIDIATLGLPDRVKLGSRWVFSQGVEYPLPLAGEIQLANSALAIAALQILARQGWQISPAAIAVGMARAKWLGRLQHLSWSNHQLLVDGAHNQAAAVALRQYVDTLNKESIAWIIGILSSKDIAGVLTALLRAGDLLYLVPVPSPDSATPHAVAAIAKEVCPGLSLISSRSDAIGALTDASSRASPGSLLVLCGSLYLVGHFLRQYQQQGDRQT